LEGPEVVPADLRAGEELNLDDLVLDEIFVKEPEPVLGVAVKEDVQNTVLDTAVLETVAERVEGAVQGPVNVETPQATLGGATTGIAATAAPAPVEPKAVVLENVAAAPVESKPIVPESIAAEPIEPKAIVPENIAAAPIEPKARFENVLSVGAPSSAAQSVPTPSAETVLPKKPLFWSAEVNAADAERPGEADRSHVPPVLRGLRKCEACGFPVSAGRVLCVECEEKKWRGQLKVPQGAGPRQVAIPAASPPVAAVPKEAMAFAAAQSAAASVATPMRRTVPAAAAASGGRAGASAAAKESGRVTAQPLAPARNANPPSPTLEPTAEALEAASRDFVFSAGMGSSQSWFSANKYVIGVVLLVAAVAVTAVFLLR
jgi:hypothetical protein